MLTTYTILILPCLFKEEFPHQAGGVDLVGGLAGDALRQVVAAGPGVTAIGNGIKDHIRARIAAFVAHSADVILIQED